MKNTTMHASFRALRLALSLCAMVLPFALAAQTPPSDLEGAALRSWLKTNYYDGQHTSLGYDNARMYLYNYVDNKTNKVTCVYSGYQVTVSYGGTTTNPSPINCEHTVPQSLFGSANPMQSDLHHLFPSYSNWNSTRSDNPYADIADNVTTKWMYLSTSQTSIPSTNINAYSESASGFFEPREDHKGNTARAIFYFYTMYPTQAGDISSLGDINTLYQWHQNDPVDANEIARNNMIESYQGTRNPYIDYPETVGRAWGFTSGTGGGTGGTGGTSIASELIISEYVEGGSFNKAIEIANYTGAPVDMSGYVLAKQSNGAGAWFELPLTGTLADGDVFIVANTAASSAILALADMTDNTGSVVNFNGNDAVALLKNGAVVDIVGPYNDPSTWGSDKTLVRQSSVTAPNATYTPAEWNTFPKDDISNLGVHTIDGGTVSCDPPGSIFTSSIGTDRATIGWTPASGAQSYSVQYKLATAGTWTTTTAGSTSLTLYSLAQGTAYNVRVATVCSGETSPYSATFTFSTVVPIVAQEPALFFSEYIEGSSFNKALEIYNGTGGTVDLSEYSIRKQTNGAGAWETPFQLVGSLGNGNVFVLLHSSADSTVRPIADSLSSNSTMSYNGNDPIGLFKGDTLVDIIGVFDSVYTFGQDVTLVRKSTVIEGTQSFNMGEWDTYPSNTFTYLGSATHSAPAPTNYCISQGQLPGMDWIKRVRLFNTAGDTLLDNFTGRNGGYFFFGDSVPTPDIVIGRTHNIFIAPGRDDETRLEAYKVWLDLNRDGDFRDAGELVWSRNLTSATSVRSNFPVSASASPGLTRIRVQVKYNQVPFGSCEVFTRGEVEDYLINLVPAGSGLAKASSARQAEVRAIFPMEVYPNPAFGEAALHKTFDRTTDATVRLYNAQGALVSEQAFGQVSEIQTSLNLQGLNAGLYIVSVSTADGELETSRLVVK